MNKYELVAKGQLNARGNWRPRTIEIHADVFRDSMPEGFDELVELVKNDEEAAAVIVEPFYPAAHRSPEGEIINVTNVHPVEIAACEESIGLTQRFDLH